MPPKSKAKVNPFQRVLGPIEDRLDFLDAAIRELHPEYSSRILDRMAYLEDLCRQHVNRVLGVINNKKAELVAKVDKVTKGLSFVVDVLDDKTAKSIKSLEDATQRHHADAKAVRRELGELKSLIDVQTERLMDERRACEKLLKEAHELVEVDVLPHRHENVVKANSFYDEQKELIRRARDAKTKEQQEELIDKAQRTAASRSPSRRPSRASSPARSEASDISHNSAWRRDPTSVSYGAWYHNNTRGMEVAKNAAEPVRQHLAGEKVKVP